MLKDIAVIPLYIGLLEITDSKKNMTWKEQVYIGLDYIKATTITFGAAKDRFCGFSNTTGLKAFIQYYHIRADGRIELINERIILKTLENSVREQLAEYAHDAWTRWMEHLFSKTIPYKPGEVQATEGAVIIPKWAVERWERQVDTKYKDLPEDEKESDRQEADKITEIVKDV